MTEEDILENIEKIMDEKEPQSSKFSISNFISIFVLNWQYFLISIIIFLSGAFLYLRYTEPTYSISARLLIKDEDSRKSRNASQMITNMMDLGFMSKSVGLENEIEIIKSRVLLRDVIRDLKLYSEYRLKGHLKDIIIYGKQPFAIELDADHLDSLDNEFIVSGQFTAMNLKIQKKDEKIIVEESISRPSSKRGDDKHVFTQELDSLPALIRTPIGTLTMTASPRYAIKPDNVYLVTVLPPMVVATKYLGSMSVEKASMETDIAQVRLVEQNVQRGMDFLRQLMVCYNRQANDDKNEIAIRTEEFINERVAQINKELGSTEEEIESFKRSNSVTGMSVDATMSVQMSNQYSTRLNEANTQIQMLDYLREFVEDPKNKFQIIPSNVGLTDPASTQLISSYNKAVLDRNRLLTALSTDAPQVQTLTATIQDLESSIKTALLQARRSADIVRQGIMSEFGKYHGQISKAPLQERVLTQIGRQLDVKSGIYLLLLQKREENSIALAATADKGKLIDEPLYEGKVKPKKSLILATALLLAFAIPFGILLIINLFRYKIEGRSDVESITNLPIIADVALANEKAKTTAGIVVHENQNTQMDEIFRSLRTNIMFMLKENQKTILFTSSTSGEGKTFCAANLATSFAFLGKKVLLCGMDIRKPALGKLFSLSDKEHGLTPLLRKNEVTMHDLEEQILNSGINANLDLLLSGPIPPNPTELLANPVFNQILQLMEEKYDYIILDTAPIGLVTDTIQIAAHADVNIYICRADYTPKSIFSILNNLNKEGKLPNACVVINGIDMSRRKYGYYYGYGRYGKYGRYSNHYGSYGSYGMYGNYSESHYSNKGDNSIKR